MRVSCEVNFVFDIEQRSCEDFVFAVLRTLAFLPEAGIQFPDVGNLFPDALIGGLRNSSEGSDLVKGTMEIR